METQDSKRDLARILLNPLNSDSGQAEPGSKRLEVWNPLHIIVGCFLR